MFKSLVCAGVLRRRTFLPVMFFSGVTAAIFFHLGALLQGGVILFGAIACLRHLPRKWINPCIVVFTVCASLLWMATPSHALLFQEARAFFQTQALQGITDPNTVTVRSIIVATIDIALFSFFVVLIAGIIKVAQNLYQREDALSGMTTLIIIFVALFFAQLISAVIFGATAQAPQPDQNQPKQGPPAPP